MDIELGDGVGMPDDSKPDHYSRLKPQPIEVIEAWDLGFHLGNVLKYIARAGHKGESRVALALNDYRELRDLRAARWYLDRRIDVRNFQLRGVPLPHPPDQE